MSASAWFNEYQAAACPACAGDDRAIHIHEACALKAQTDLREALAEAREEVERLTGVVAGASDDVRDAAKEWRYWNARALAAERARDEAVAEVARLKEALENAQTALGDAHYWFKRAAGGPRADYTMECRTGEAEYAARRALGRTDGEGA